MKRLTKGFTLIELLVVIAIIGILSSVVLASLNTARGKGANASVKSQMANMRAQAELFYDNNSATYGTPSTNSCTTAGSLFMDQVFVNARASITNTSGAPTCNSTAAAWAMSAPLKVADGANTHWCVDSAGVSKGQTAALASGVTACTP